MAARPVDLDTVSARWRAAFDAEEDALRAIVVAGIAVPSTELHERSTRLAHERPDVGLLLDQSAREEHVLIHHRVSAPRATRRLLGLPHDVVACVFDLDGVLTASASLHAAAWSDALDELLARRLERTGERFAPYMPFDRV